MKSLDEMQVEIQENFIKSIKSSVSSETIRFWTENERISDDEIVEKYPTVYNVWVHYNYKKGSKRPSITAIVGRDFDATGNTLLNAALLDIDPSVITKFKTWAKASASCINQYLQDRNDYFLREIRFDLLPDLENKGKYIVPNIPLMNVHFSKSRRGPLITVEEYVTEQYDDYRAALEFQARKPS